MAREVVLDPSPSHTGLDVNERSPPCKSDPCYRRTQGLVTSSSWHRRCWHKATPVRRRSSARAWSLSRHRSVTRLRRAGRSARCSRRHTERRLAADACEPTRRLASGHPLRLSNGALPPLLPPAAAPLCWLSPDNRQHPDAAPCRSKRGHSPIAQGLAVARQACAHRCHHHAWPSWRATTFSLHAADVGGPQGRRGLALGCRNLR